MSNEEMWSNCVAIIWTRGEVERRRGGEGARSRKVCHTRVRLCTRSRAAPVVQNGLCHWSSL